ncbi:hypothetical protein [Cohnella luojiensis]|uniref:Endolytic transglycosylase MltG n=1 Tax=Cohnella luojiensis TaxID=652876 RepID=A0A4Y8LSK9_9BACL|nr:hypothetical protein [Cohnella luojiensis]TFE24400.1 hypothetical protein E2980_16255 [Cohnella luojiensis]
MRKYRSWLMGLGIGLIIGASMLQLIQLAQEQAVMVAEEPITREQLKDEAEKADLVLLTEEQLAAKVESAVSAALQDEAPKTQGESEGNKETNSALKPPEPSKDPEPKTATLNVTYGMTLTEVADELKMLGVIEDAEDFIYVASSIAKKMSVGKSTFTGKPTYKAIMQELTREK